MRGRFLRGCRAAVLLLLPTVVGAAELPTPPPHATPAAAPRPLPSDGLPRRLVLALDGIPYDAFRDAQERGHFSSFRPARRMVSTFPSLSDVAFSAIVGSDPPVGYQVMRFDPEKNHVVGNTLHSLSSAAHDHIPMDTRQHSAAGRMLSYMAPYRRSVKELGEMREDFLASDKETFVAYIEATDALLHINGRTAAARFLVQLDGFLDDLTAEVQARTGRDLKVDIVSDHGSTFEKGRRARLQRTLEDCSYRRTRRLESSRDVAYSQAGIIGSAAISCDPAQSEAVARCLVEEDGVELVMFEREGAVVVLSRDGEAEVRLQSSAPERYSYLLLQGDPLGLAASLPERIQGDQLVASQEELFGITLDGPYPDPLRRTWRAFHGAVQRPAEVLVSLADGYEAANATVRVLAKLRGRDGTHGSLTSAASLGVLTSNWRDVKDASAWNVRDILFGEQVVARIRLDAASEFSRIDLASHRK